MKYADLTPDEIRLNIIEPLADTMICIAHANDVFVCSECLDTLAKIQDILGCLDSAVAKKTIAEVNAIME